MEIAYLGLFDEVFEWVLSRIFDPIFKWLSNLLTTVLTWVFNEIFEPILGPILESVIEFAFELWMDIYSTFIYGIFSAMLKLIDYMETAFDVFIGLRDVSFTEKVGNESITVSGSLLEVLLQQDTINTIFWAFTLAGLGIALVLTIYATAKSAFDLDFENRRPVSKVLASMMKTFITFFTVPFVMYFIIQLATAVLEGATYVLKGGNNTTLGRIVFMIASLDAVDLSLSDAAKYNVSTASGNITLGTTAADKYRYPFYSLNAANPKDYADMKAVMEFFDLSNFDYFIGFIAGIFLLVVMAMCLLTFVQRIFEVILLYAASPYFVSMIPIDEGERFGRWRDMFISKVLTGFGSAIGMRLYLLVCPMIMGNQIQFGMYVSTEMDYIMKLFFLIGGAWAVYKSGPMITSLFSFSAGQKEAVTSEMVGGYFYGHTVGKAMGAGKQLIKGGAGGGASKAAASKNATKSKEQKFAGGKSDGTAKAVGKGKTAMPKASENHENKWKQGVKPEGERTPSPITIGAKRKPVTAAENAPAAVTVSNGSEKQKSNFSLGSLIKSTYDENGNHKIRVLGIGATRDANGNTTSVKLPGMKLSKTGDGSYKVSKLHIPKVTKVKGNVENGELKYSDISVLGMRYQKNAEGSSFAIGSKFNIAHDKDGNRKELQVGSYHSYERDGKKTYDIGSKISLQKDKSEGKISSIKIGSLNYSKAGKITKTTDQTGTGGDKA